jgi:hypothetical protein
MIVNNSSIYHLWLTAICLVVLFPLLLLLGCDSFGLEDPAASIDVRPDVRSVISEDANTGVWFVTDPPDPALVGDTYNVEVRSDGPGFRALYLESLTPAICFGSEASSIDVLYVTVNFVTAGDCGLRAVSLAGDDDTAYQIFSVYEPSNTPAPIMKTCTKTDHIRPLSLKIPLDRDCPRGWD